MSHLRIGQLAKRAGCTVKTVRFYEAKGLLAAPARSAAGYRLYTDGHLRRLQVIRRAKLLGLSLAKIRTLVVHLSDDRLPGAALRPHLARLIREELDEIGAKLRQLAVLRGELEGLLAKMHAAKGGFPRELCVCATPPEEGSGSFTPFSTHANSERPGDGDRRASRRPRIPGRRNRLVLDCVYPLARDRLSFPELLPEHEPHTVREVYVIQWERPRLIIDVTETMEVKLEAIRCHASQVGDVKAVEARMRSRAASLGKEKGYPCAEGFDDIVVPG